MWGLKGKSNPRYKHGHSVDRVVTPTFKSYRAMMQRCYYPRSIRYAQYGGRGIGVCERWREAFVNFLADMGERPPSATLERIDVNRDYEPGNVRWASAKEQARNRTSNTVLTVEGRTQCLAAWAEEKGINLGTLQRRIRLGWPDDELFGPLVPRGGERPKGQRVRREK